MKEIEYRVRPVSRYVVTRYCREEDGASCETVGEFPNRTVAANVARAMSEANGATFTENILPYSDVPALLRNIAEDAERSSAFDGVVILQAKEGTSVFGLGAKDSHDPFAVMDAGYKAMESLIS